MIFECPGSKSFKQPKPESLKCPYCGEETELWSDESEASCPKCKKVVARQPGASCLDWCRYAKQCVSEEVYNNYMKQKQRKGG